MSVSAPADAFFQEIAQHGTVWTIRDEAGIPAPVVDGEQIMPFWSLRSRAESIIAEVPAYAGFHPDPIPVRDWRVNWLPGLQQDGLLVGLNWSGARAAGVDLAPAQVLAQLGVRPGG